MDVKGARILAERIAQAQHRPAAEDPRAGETRCAECGGPIAAVLVRLGSASCHDCRSGRPVR